MIFRTRAGLDISKITPEQNLVLDDRGEIHEVGDSWEDDRYYMPPEQSDTHPEILAALETLDLERRINYPVKRFLQFAENQTGVYVDEETRQDDAKNQNDRLKASYIIAQKMIACGIPAFSESETTLYYVGQHTRAVEKIPRFRRCNFLPVVAYEKRAKRLNNFKYFLSLEQNSFCYDGVITSGERCSFNKIINRKKQMEEEMKAVSKERWFSSVAEFVLKSFECTVSDKKTDEIQRDDNGNLTFHPHFHFVIRLKRYQTKKKYAVFCEKFRSMFKGKTDINEQIQRPEEFLKYLLKTNDLIRIKNSEFADFFNLMFKKQLVFACGTFAELEKKIKLADKTATPPCAANNFRWSLEPNINSNHGLKKEPTTEQILKEFAASEADIFALEKYRKNRKPKENVVVAILPPQARFCSLKEPLLLIRNYTGGQDAWDEIMSDPRVKQVYEATKEHWQSGRDLCALQQIEVHTTPIIISDAAQSIQQFLPLGHPPPPKPPPTFPKKEKILG